MNPNGKVPLLLLPVGRRLAESEQTPGFPTMSEACR
jgi:hypothetical protein